MVEPIACALDTPHLQDRMRGWAEVIPLSARGIPDGVVVEFPPDAATARRLLELVAAERVCCGWAEWTLTSTASGTRLDVTAAGAGPASLHVMFGVST